MPGFNQTGPAGLGQMTGRGMGPCGRGGGIGMRTGFGRYHGFGRGLGRYFGWNTPQTKEELESYKKALEEELEDVESQLNKLP